MLLPPRRSHAFVCHSVCEHNYCKNNEPISLKLGDIIGPTSRKNLLTFGDDPIPDTDSGSLFYFPHNICGIRDFRRFVIFSYGHRPIFTTLGKMTDVDKIMNPQHFGNDPADIRIRIRVNP